MKSKQTRMIKKLKIQNVSRIEVLASFLQILFSISLANFWKMLLLASSSKVLHGVNLYLPSTQYCKLKFNFENSNPQFFKTFTTE